VTPTGTPPFPLVLRFLIILAEFATARQIMQLQFLTFLTHRMMVSDLAFMRLRIKLNPDMTTRRKNAAVAISDFGKMVWTARKQKKHWSQAVLSQKASVATRTIVTLEKGKSHPEKSIVIRLADALGENVQDWLQKCGYEKASDEEIHNAMRASRQLHFAGERPPENYFLELRQRVGQGHKILMCVAYLSPPGAQRRPDLKDLVLDSVNHGLHLAMVCPYPRILNPATVPKPNLSFYYSDVYNWVLAFAREMHERLKPESKSRLAVFVPNVQEEDQSLLHCVPPPTGLADYRPTLVMDDNNIKGDDSCFELAAWFVMQQDKRDRWLPIFPAPTLEQETVASSSRHLQFWKDYFSEILKAFSEGGWSKLKHGNKNAGWRLEFPIESSQEPE
jgi:DNA-binding XRE family transcriptional regulator